MVSKCISIDKNPFLISFSQTLLGKFLIIALFTFLMNALDIYSTEWKQTLVAVIVVISLFPKYRHLWLFIGMCSLLLQGYLIKSQPDWLLFKAYYLYVNFKNGYTSFFTPGVIKIIDVLLVIFISEIFIYLMRRFQKFKLLNYSITISYLFVIALILIVVNVPMTGVNKLFLWSFIAVYVHYFWFIAYTFRESRIIKRDYLLDYARYLPTWGFTTIPYGKGSIYLQQVESKTEHEFSVTRLKAVKLIIWAFLLNIVLSFVHKGEAYFHIPTLQVALHDYSNGMHYTVYHAWVCVIDRFFREMLALTVYGHLVVASCRMCGFRILRNTYRPLQSQSIAEFWNRYNYYFKELLVEFFFYPAYFRFFKSKPKMRLFFATLSAATFGNILFHFLLTLPVVMSVGLVKACLGSIPFICYAIVLGIAIGLSQLHNSAEKAPSTRMNRYVVYPVLVLAFYAVLGIFNQSYQSESILSNLKLLGSLFNITG